MPQLAKSASFAALGLFLLTAAGCNDSIVMDAKTLDAHRTRLTLADEPDGVQTVADVRAALLGDGHEDHAAEDHAAEGHDEHEDEEGEDHKADGHDQHDGHDEHARGTESIDVHMVGHIGGLANPWAEAQPEFPFAKTQAVFFLADPQAIVENEASGHAHAPGEECAFCAAHAADQADMLAMVQFVDKNGKVLPTDVRQLFEVKEKDIVVISGKARVTAGGILVVDAQGLYIRK